MNAKQRRKYKRKSCPKKVTFYGITRSVGPSMLAGVRYDGPTHTLQELIEMGTAHCIAQAGRPISSRPM